MLRFAMKLLSGHPSASTTNPANADQPSRLCLSLAPANSVFDGLLVKKDTCDNDLEWALKTGR